jgi:hypothetical protein
LVAALLNEIRPSDQTVTTQLCDSFLFGAAIGDVMVSQAGGYPHANSFFAQRRLLCLQ